MITRVLIANRGEIARRIIRTCRGMGIATVAVHSDADAAEPHVREADQAVRIGPAAAASSYLDIDRVVSVAVGTGCDAVHPGYGFLAENAAFARAVVDASLIFIGPSPDVIELMGDKAAAKRALAAVGVPVVPGEDADDLDDDALIEAAARVGTPLLVKAVAGGGGKGMRAVHDDAQLPAAISAARREARSAFGDDRLILERLVPRPRHIEIQVFADDEQTVHLLERECSVQRRHQKVVEEAPSPAVDEELRSAMGAAAVTAAAAVGYRGAGTVEFLVDGASLDRGEPEFYFLEMNTRLQVEHPVTEAVTGFDLVEMQLAVAAGSTLGLTQDQVRANGHAIEVRVYAEDPINQLPQTGQIDAIQLAEHARNDMGVEVGSAVSRHYDPMLGKIIVHAADRAAACDAVVAALAETHIAGVITNVDLLAAIVDHPRFRAGDLTTAFIDENLASWLPPSAPAAAVAAAAVALHDHQLPRPDPGDPTSPWTRLGAFRVSGVGGSASTFVEATDPEQRPRSAVVRRRGSQIEAHVDDELVTPSSEAIVDISDYADHTGVSTGSASIAASRLWVHDDGRTACLVHHPTARHADATAPSGEASFTSPMPGAVLALPVVAGERVSSGAVLALVEAMKMEHPVRAPANGTVTAVYVAVGDAVDTGTPLVAFDPDLDEAGGAS